MQKFADESRAGIWKLPKDLSGLSGGGWNELKTDCGDWKGGCSSGINGLEPGRGIAGGNRGGLVPVCLLIDSIDFW